MSSYTTNGNTNTKVIVTAKEELDNTITKLNTEMTLKINEIDQVIDDKSKEVDDKAEELKGKLQDSVNQAQEIYSRVSLADNQEFIIHDYDFFKNTETGKYEYVLEHNLGDTKIQWTARDINNKEAVCYIEPKYGSNVNKALIKVRYPQYISLIANRGYYGGQTTGGGK